MRKHFPALVAISLTIVSCLAERATAAPGANPTAGGYFGIWYTTGAKEYEGGFALFPSQHSPMAVYRAEVQKTFFVYGGTVAGKPPLCAMAAYYDHQRGVVPRPTIVHDWGAPGFKRGGSADAHRNPTICVDGEGRVWVFVSGHGDAGYVYRATQPYSVESFEQVLKTPMTYPYPWWIPGKGLFVFLTRYDHNREQYWIAASDAKRLVDAETWASPGQLSAWSVGAEAGKPGHGIYQFTAARGARVATVLNNWIGRTRDRSNLFYLQSDDMGRLWQTADGKDFKPPIREVKCRALVRDFWGEGFQVYIQHVTFDRQGRPAILFLTSPAHQTNEGPGGPRTWTVAHWLGDRWAFHAVTTSSHNFDCGSLSIEEDGTWRIIGPTQPGPQLWRTGGEVAMWTSQDEGATWKMARQLTVDSKHNHCYVRRPVDAHPDFYALWGDGHGNDRSAVCRLYFCTKAGEVRRLPTAMAAPLAKPEAVERK